MAKIRFLTLRSGKMICSTWNILDLRLNVRVFQEASIRRGQSLTGLTASCLASLLIPLKRRLKSSAPIFTNLPCIRVRLKELARAIVLRLKIKLLDLPKKNGIRFFLNRKESRRMSFMSTAFQPACRLKFRLKWFDPSLVARMQKSCGPPTLSNMILPFQPRFIHHLRPKPAKTCSLLARLTAHPVTKKLERKVSWRASMQLEKFKISNRLSFGATRLISEF